MFEKVKEFINKMNAKGIPLPLLRDPKSSYASVSLTMTVISFNVVLIGLIGKWSQMLGGIDITQALYWFGMCAGLYFGRTIVKRKNSLKIKEGKEE